MSGIRASGSRIETALGKALWAAGVRYRRQYGRLPGRPDFAIVRAKIAIFCDSSFWHGRDWPASAAAFKTNREFWLPKIERNIRRDVEVTASLCHLHWTVIRFWDDDILKRLDACVVRVLDAAKEALDDKQ